MKRPYYFGILVFSALIVSVLAQADLRQLIQLDTSTVIGFRKRIEKLPPKPAAQKPAGPGVIRLPSEKTLYLYDVVVIDRGIETVLETIETVRIGDVRPGVYAPFTLLAASIPVVGEIVYVYSTDGKFYVATARRGADSRFQKVSRDLVAQGIRWEKAKLKNEDGVLRVYIEGDSQSPKVFERQESGSFVLKSQ